MRLHHPDAADWERYRELRLAMLAGAPEAYGSNLAREVAFTEETWRGLLTPRPDRRVVVAVGDDDRWHGAMTVVPGDDAAKLVAVWVEPQWRGSGAADAMLTDLVEWVRSSGHERILLDVHEDNPRAIRLYRRHGFVDTGARVPFPNPPHGLEVQMELRLSRPTQGQAGPRPA